MCSRSWQRYSKPKAAPAPITSGLPLLLSREDVAAPVEAIGKVVRSQDGAEVVSRLLATDASAPPLVVTSLLPELPYLASHPNGAGVISDLFVACRKARDHGSTTIPAMTRRLQGSLLRLTKDRWGCRVMQAALEEASPEFQQAFASELQGKALKLCQHLHANFVLQKYVELLPSSAGAFILQELTPHALEVAAHVYGCRVLQRLIEHCSKEPELSKLVEHASLVFERCLEASSERSGDFPERDLLVDPLADGGEEVMEELLLGDGTSRAPLAQILLDRFGNYLAQRMIHCCRGKEEPRVAQLLGRCLPKLQRSPQGRHITMAATKRFGRMPQPSGTVSSTAERSFATDRAQAGGRPPASVGEAGPNSGS
ncbi:unnamed protein product [Durusdinium trenchii]|uniref:Pumilio homolog 4 (APUM-4) (AtPUM4) n=2 Tax=Durusdinium trenchii TaxID=1381693 RepID=A0ABP0PTT0_9DINO